MIGCASFVARGDFWVDYACVIYWCFGLVVDWFRWVVSTAFAGCLWFRFGITGCLVSLFVTGLGLIGVFIGFVWLVLLVVLFLAGFIALMVGFAIVDAIRC